MNEYILETPSKYESIHASGFSIDGAFVVFYKGDKIDPYPFYAIHSDKVITVELLDNG